MTETELKYLRMMIEDLTINSHDSMQMIANYQAKTGLDCPLLQLLHSLKQNPAVQDDDQQVEQIDAMRQDLITYLSWRQQHPALDAQAILAGIEALPASLRQENPIPAGENLLGILTTGKILVQNHFPDSDKFMPPQFDRVTGMLPETPAGKQWHHWLEQLSRMFAEKREEELFNLAQNSSLTG